MSGCQGYAGTLQAPWLSVSQVASLGALPLLLSLVNPTEKVGTVV